MNNITNKSNLIKFSALAFTKLMLGLYVSLGMLPTEKASANNTPSMYINSNAIPVSFETCKSRANKAANLFFNSGQKPVGDGNVYFVILQTASTAGFIQCSRHPRGSSYVVGTSAYWLQDGNEAQSLRTRMAKVMLGRI
ncbi:MAG: hypothetical protein KI793_33170 [Rivularia sp. (in: Bacteria)]|nr:hypothetical protein [Rivularia sp. MS3]